MSLEIINHETVEDLFERAARDFVVCFDDAIRTKSVFNVALSGGSTAKIFFSFLVNQLSGHENLSRLRFYFSDERVVDIDSEDSNAGNAIRNLLAPLKLNRDQFFPIYDGKNSGSTCAHNYEKLISSFDDIDQHGVPVFDLIYLGVGQDGHTASLFPHNEILADEKHLVLATTEEAFAYERITMMPRLLKASTNICVLAYGPSKSDILDAIINGPKNPEALPAQMIMRDASNNVTLLTADLDGVV